MIIVFGFGEEITHKKMPRPLVNFFLLTSVIDKTHNFDYFPGFVLFLRGVSVLVFNADCISQAERFQLFSVLV